MKIPLRPEQYETTLPEHAELETRPVFVYAAFTPAEEADWSIRAAEAGGAFEEEAEAEGPRILRADQLRALTRLYNDLFDAQLIRIDGLVVGAEPFDRAQHLGHLPSRWKVAVGREILQRTNTPLTEAEEGN